MNRIKASLFATTAAIFMASAGSAFAAGGSVNSAAVTIITPPVQTQGAGATTDTSIGAIDDSTLPAGFPGQTATAGHSYSELLQAVESDGSGANAVINGEGDLTLNAFDDGEANSSLLNLTGTTMDLSTGTANITTTGGTNIVGGVSVTGGINNNNGGITNIGAISGVTSLSISGVANLAGGITTSTLTTSGLATLDSLAVVHDASIGGALSVSGMANLAGGATITGGAGKSLVVDASGTTGNGGAQFFSGTGTGNAIAVDSTSSRLVSGANNVTVSANGVGASGNGAALALNGTAASFANSNGRGLVAGPTSTTITGGGAAGNVSTLSLSASNASLLTKDGSGFSATQGGAVSVTGAQGSGTQRAGLALSASGSDVSLTNNTGHGLTTTASATTLSGGTSSTTLTLDDSGASFAGTSGAPAKVTGVAPGRTQFDAVNFGQLQGLEKEMSSGTAMASALAGMPQVDPNKTWGVAMGGGYFNGQGAASLGISFRDDNKVFKLGIADGSQNKATVNGGVGFSW